MQPLLESDRDKRTWSWICSQVGEAAALGALDGLAGNRRPYPSNAARALGLVVPGEVVATSREVAKKHLADLQAILKK